MVFGIGSITCGNGTCNTENPKDARFCKACGESLSPTCPNPACKAPLKSGNRFCHLCGTAIGEADTSRETVDWRREPGDFALKIDLAKDDRRQYGGIIVPHGTKAVIVEDGMVVEQLIEGKYMVPAIETAALGVGGSDGGLRKLFRFWKAKENNPSLTYPDVSVFFMDAGEVLLEYSIKAKTSDPRFVDVGVDVRVSLEFPLRFIANKLKGNLAYTEGDVKKDFESVIQRVMEREIGKFRYDDLQSKVDDIVVSLQGETNNVVERDGYSLTMLSLRIRQEGRDAADEIKSDTVGMREVGNAALEQGRVQVDLRKGQAGLENEAQDIEVQKTLDQRNRESILSDDSRLRGKKSADAEHTDTVDEVARKRERELLARGHKKEDLRDDMGTESEVKDFGRSEEIKDVKKDVVVGDLKSDAELARKAKELKLHQETRDQKSKSQVERVSGYIDLLGKKDDVRQKGADAEHKRVMEKTTKEQEFKLADKNLDIQGTLEGEKIKATRDVDIKRTDVDIAKVDAEGSRKLAEIQEALRKESKADGKETLEMFKQFAEKNAELLAGSADRRVKEIKETADKHGTQLTDLALAKAKGLGTATGKESPRVQCPNPDCGAELERGSKFCGKCGKTLLA
jgi:hypothetical protein